LQLTDDFSRLDEVLKRLRVIDSRAPQTQLPEDLYLLTASGAFELQQLYTGFEKVIERHFKFKQELPQADKSYHKTLLNLAFEEGLITGAADIDFLTDLLAFRHLSRSAYGLILRTDETLEKVKTASDRWLAIAVELKQKLGLEQSQA
jgi:hypothetical protein